MPHSALNYKQGTATSNEHRNREGLQAPPRSTARAKADSTRAAISQFFGLSVDRPRFFSMRSDLSDALIAAEVPEGQYVTLVTLYQMALEAFMAGNRSEGGGWLLTSSLDTISARRRLVRRATSNHVQSLTRAGCVDMVSFRGGQVCLRLMPVPTLVERLHAMPGVQRRLEEMRPETYSESYFRRNDQASSAERVPDAVLLAPDTQPLASELGAAMEKLQKGIRDRLESSVVIGGVKDQQFLRELLEEYGPERIDKVIEYVTDPYKWAAFRSERDVKRMIPTPGVLRSFSADLVSLAVDRWKLSQPKRSGNARPEPMSMSREDSALDAF